jgi:hypothetical protein
VSSLKESCGNISQVLVLKFKMVIDSNITIMETV